MKKKLLTGFIIVLAAVFIYSEGNREVEPVRSRDIPKSEVPKGIVIAGPPIDRFSAFYLAAGKRFFRSYPSCCSSVLLQYGCHDGIGPIR